jgi:hypothetical protein
MKVFALVQRLARDLTQTNPLALTAEERQTVQDCINAALQKLHDYAPDHSKTVPVALSLAAPTAITIGVTQGLTTFTGYSITSDDQYCTIRIDGDGVDNQVIAAGTLLHPYAGTTGTVTATIYHDAIALDETYATIVSNPRHLDTNLELGQGHYPDRHRLAYRLAVGEPESWLVEANAYGSVRAIFRVDRLPLALIRLKAKALLAPPRVSFTDTIDATVDIAMRVEHIESYLLPMIRGLLAETSLWRDVLTRKRAMDKGDNAALEYNVMVPKSLTTPSNTVGTPEGY